MVGGGGRWNTILQVVSKVIGCAVQKIVSIHKILVMVFQYSHCQDTGTPVLVFYTWIRYFLLIISATSDSQEPVETYFSCNNKAQDLSSKSSLYLQVLPRAKLLL